MNFELVKLFSRLQAINTVICESLSVVFQQFCILESDTTYKLDAFLSVVFTFTVPKFRATTALITHKVVVKCSANKTKRIE